MECRKGGLGQLHKRLACGTLSFYVTIVRLGPRRSTRYVVCLWQRSMERLRHSKELASGTRLPPVAHNGFLELSGGQPSPPTPATMGMSGASLARARASVPGCNVFLLRRSMTIALELGSYVPSESSDMRL